MLKGGEVLKLCYDEVLSRVDHKRVYEEEGLWSWCLVLVIQVTEVWLL